MKRHLSGEHWDEAIHLLGFQGKPIQSQGGRDLKDNSLDESQLFQCRIPSQNIVHCSLIQIQNNSSAQSLHDPEPIQF
jgi:hypothetical protein